MAPGANTNQQMAAAGVGNLMSAGDRSTQATQHQFGLQAFQSSQTQRNQMNSIEGYGGGPIVASKTSHERYPSSEDAANNNNNILAQPTQPSSDMDPYAPSIVQDLLAGANEWRNIQDIIKLTLKAVCEVVRTQGLAIRELERVLPTKCNKSELNAGLSLKANVSDVSRTVADVAASIDTKLSTDDVQNLLDEKVSKTDM